MKTVFGPIVVVFKVLFGLLLLLAIVGLVLIFFFGAPTALVFETIDIVKMDAKTSGTVKHVEVKEEGDGTSSTEVSYEFKVDGETYESKRMFPGFLGNIGSYTGGGDLASHFEDGQECTVYYDSSAPAKCALQYGWFSWSVGWTALVWGGIFAAGFKRMTNPLEVFASALVVYGVLLVFFGPHTVELSKSYWHLITLLGVFAVVVINYLFVRRRVHLHS